jgi:hypothetical protein
MMGIVSLRYENDADVARTSRTIGTFDLLDRCEEV